MNLDEIYGCTLGEYLEYHNKSKEDLMYELRGDIELLNKSYRRYADDCTKFTLEELTSKATLIHDLMQKKKRHLDRIEKWI